MIKLRQCWFIITGVLFNLQVQKYSCVYQIESYKVRMKVIQTHCSLASATISRNLQLN